MAFAPATVANLSVGFDLLGLAMEGAGDTVRAQITEEPGVSLRAVEGDQGKLPRIASENTAGIAAQAVLTLAGSPFGVALSLSKGLPIGSGLGSSAASAAAAAFAVNALLDEPLPLEALILPCMEAEAAVAGRHADNVAPALLGGLCFVQSLDPLRILRLPVPLDLFVAVVTPAMELSSRKARGVLPQSFSMAEMIRSTSRMGAFCHALHTGDMLTLTRLQEIDPITQARAPLIPGALQVIEAAMNADALLSSISGAGPSIFALVQGYDASQQVLAAMVAAFDAAGLQSHPLLSPAQALGARLLPLS